jgi:hypothetical protein
MTLDPTYKYIKHWFWPIITIRDMAGYQRGWIFAFWFIKIMKLKTSKIMESPRYITIIEIFNYTNLIQ